MKNFIACCQTAFGLSVMVINTNSIEEARTIARRMDNIEKARRITMGMDDVWSGYVIEEINTNKEGIVFYMN